MAERMRIDHTGNVGIGTTAPLSKLSAVGSIASTQTKMSAEGGYLVRIVNNSGVTVSSGIVVNSTGTTVDNAFNINPVDGYMPIGVMYGPVTTDAMGSCANAQECWICTSGKCMVQYDSGSCTRAQWAGASATNAGLVNCVAEPASVAKHDMEIGHVINSGASGMAWIMAHFR
jgi:hypothetical protein